MFEPLGATLRPSPEHVEVNHKPSFMYYDIMLLKSMRALTSQREIELAVSSNKVTINWIYELVNRTDSFPLAANDVMCMVARRCGWIHAELWTVARRVSSSCRGGHEMEEYVVISFCPDINAHGSKNYL